MIQLDIEKLPEHFARLMPQYRPTHAKLLSHHRIVVPSGHLIPMHGYTAQKDNVHLWYFYGTLDEQGEFIPVPGEKPVQLTLFMMSPEQVASDTYSDLDRQKSNAVKNIRSKGITPHPERPWESVDCHPVKEDDYRTADLDAYVAAFHLLGVVV